MIERKFVAEKVKELQVEEFIGQEIGKDKYSYLEIKKTPLGEKIIIHTSKPGLVVGKKGETIKNLTTVLKTKFKMENPQIEVAEIKNPELDAKAMAEYIVMMFERFGANRFKSIGYKALQRIMDAGAMGAEIVISGRGVPSSRAKSWRFYDGYIKKSGDVSVSKVSRAITFANLRSGTIGIKVSIMPPDLVLPDSIIVKEAAAQQEPLQVEPKPEETKVPAEEKQEEKPAEEKPKRKSPKKKAASKSSKSKKENKENKEKEE